MPNTYLAIIVIAVAVLAAVLYLGRSGRQYETAAQDFDFKAAAGIKPSGVDVITRIYRGPLPQATAAFQTEARSLAEMGYVPSTQQYTPGSYSAANFLVALLLCLLLVGILVFVYMIIVKPPGTLTVTYVRRTLPVHGSTT